MFLGKHDIKVGRKQSCQVPVSYKRQLKGSFYVIQGFEQNLICLTEAPFQEIFRKISSQNITDPLARLLLRLLLSSAHMVQTDKDGSFKIPDPLFNLIGNKTDLCIIGQGDYFEIWSLDVWKKQEDQLLDCDQNAKRFSSLEITLR